MHPSNKRAYELLARLEGLEVTERDHAAVDAVEAWDILKQRSTPARRREPDPSVIYRALGLREQQQAGATMDEQTQRNWNDWADDRISTIVSSAVDVIGEEVGEDFRKLSAEIDKLRAEVTLLRGQIDGTVKTLRGRDVDAA